MRPSPHEEPGDSAPFEPSRSIGPSNVEYPNHVTNPSPRTTREAWEFVPEPVASESFKSLISQYLGETDSGEFPHVFVAWNGDDWYSRTNNATHSAVESLA